LFHLFRGPESHLIAFTVGYIIHLFAALLVSNLGALLSNTGWVARAVLALLLVFSVVSWAMIFQKLGLFSKIRRDSDQFLRIFRATRGVANPQALASAGSPFASVYASGFRELQNQLNASQQTSSGANGHLKSLSAVTVSMQIASSEEVRRAEKGMAWLATTASVSPFIGLFGTVWGIIDAFSRTRRRRRRHASRRRPRHLRSPVHHCRRPFHRHSRRHLL
jgi:biopolymer transport protein TolQ